MKYWFGYLVAAIFGAISWVLMQFGEKFATLVDMIYPYVIRTLQGILAEWTSVVDYPVWQLLAVVLGVLILASFVLMILLKWNPIQWGGWVLAVFSAIFMFHTIFWGLNYYAGDLAEDMRLEVSSYNLEELTEACEFYRDQANALAEGGKTPLLFARDGKLLGIIAVADVIKEEAPQAVKELRDMGLRVIMLTGDNEKTAIAIGKQAGVDEVIAGVLPDGKESVIRRLKTKGKVAMVGDGINDAPALTRADMGIAIGAGADVAVDAADVVLMKSDLLDVPAAIRLSRATLKNIHENLFWAFIYNVIGIPLAAGVWINLFGWQLSPMFGAAAMSLSSFCVVSNALRLNLKNIRDPRHDHKVRARKEKKKMEKVMKIEGMMCPHCQARVKKTLEALPQVEEAEVNWQEGTAVVKLSQRVDNEVLKKAVEDQDYQVLSVE